ncbi:23146_t:CDS:2, partial [Racocetra persica]
MSEYSDCSSTREALKTIFSKASDEQISKYERQLANVKILDPVLMIVPNQNWIHQHGWPTNTELYTVRRNIENLFPNAFMDQLFLQASTPNPRLYPIGMAWILTNVAKRKSDFGEDDKFFYSH